MRQRTKIPAEEIARHIAHGKANKEIADEMGLKPDTIKKYIHRLLRKTNCRNRTELAIKLLELNV